MYTYLNRFRFLECALALAGLYGCATVPPEIQAQKTLLSRASYEQIRPAIEKLKVGDEMSKVLEIARPKKDNGQTFRVTKMGQYVEYLVYPMWPGVLTPFWDRRIYLQMRADEGAGKGISLTTTAIHFGYLDGDMLRPRRILIFENNKKVSKIIDIPDFIEELVKEPGVTAVKVGPLDHLRKQAYEKYFLPKKDLITPGMDVWEVFNLLNASYIVTADVQSFVNICPGFLNYKRSVKAEKTPEGVRAIYPFGYMVGDTEIVKWDVEMLNYRVVDVRAHKEYAE